MKSSNESSLRNCSSRIWGEGFEPRSKEIEATGQNVGSFVGRHFLRANVPIKRFDLKNERVITFEKNYIFRQIFPFSLVKIVSSKLDSTEVGIEITQFFNPRSLIVRTKFVPRYEF